MNNGNYHLHTPNSIGQALHKERTRKAWTLKNLAEKSGLSVSYLSDLERNKSTPSIETLGKLAEAMGQRLELVWRETGEDLIPLTPAETELVYAVRDGDLRGAIALLYALTEKETK